MTAPYRPGNLPVSETRRTRINTVSDAAGGPFTVSGMQEIQGTGEVTFVVNFPVRFMEMPVFTFGAHVGGMTGAVSYLQSGSYPTLSAFVVNWNTGNGPNTGTPFYQGATIAAVITGLSDQIITLHFEFKGKAMSFLPTGRSG